MKNVPNNSALVSWELEEKVQWSLIKLYNKQLNLWFHFGFCYSYYHKHCSWQRAIEICIAGMTKLEMFVFHKSLSVRGWFWEFESRREVRLIPIYFKIFLRGSNEFYIWPIFIKEKNQRRSGFANPHLSGPCLHNEKQCWLRFGWSWVYNPGCRLFSLPS